MIGSQPLQGAASGWVAQTLRCVTEHCAVGRRALVIPLLIRHDQEIPRREPGYRLHQVMLTIFLLLFEKPFCCYFLVITIYT